MYHRGKLYLWDMQNNEKSEYLVDIPLPGVRKIMIRFRLLERLFRMEPRLAIAIEEGRFLLSCSGKIYCVDVQNKALVEELQLRPRMNNPLMFAKKRNGNVLFGEYFSNNGSEEVCIFERTSGKWKKVYSFSAGSIYHIHGLLVHGDDIYILTGDADRESAIWYTRDSFEHVEMLVGGSQEYRSCVAYPFRDGLLYATDTPLAQNYLFYLHQKNGIWVNEVLWEMPGPCIFGTQRKDGFYFATSVEPDATLSGMRYRFTYRLGKGVRDRYTHMIHCSKDGEIREVTRLKKDLWPMLLFQFGNFQFPNADLDDPLIGCPQSVKKFDGKTLEF